MKEMGCVFLGFLFVSLKALFFISLQLLLLETFYIVSTKTACETASREFIEFKKTVLIYC